jgi:hypothetical protein
VCVGCALAVEADRSDRKRHSLPIKATGGKRRPRVSSRRGGESDVGGKERGRAWWSLRRRSGQVRWVDALEVQALRVRICRGRSERPQLALGPGTLGALSLRED